MTHGGSDGLVVDAEVRRGGFTLAVSLTAASGQVLGLLGPNGAGKSTLLSAVAGLTPVSAGRITLAGQVLDDADTGAFAEASRRPVGFVFQNYRLFPHLTVAENVAFSPRARGLGRQAARSAASYWLDRLRLADLAERKPDQLSGGQAQRVALARALAGQPALLLLDEPLSALDAGTRLDVQAELNGTWPTSPDHACWSPTTRWKRWCSPTSSSSSRTGGSSRTAAPPTSPASPAPSTSPGWSA